MEPEKGTNSGCKRPRAMEPEQTQTQVAATTIVRMAMAIEIAIIAAMTGTIILAVHPDYKRHSD